MQIRKLAIKNKYPDLSKAPSTIRYELYHIGLEQGGIIFTDPQDLYDDNGIMTSSGIKMRPDIAEHYEYNMDELAKLREKNEEYISSKEIQDFEKNFKFLHLDFEAMEKEEASIQSLEDCEKLIEKYEKIDSELLPRAEEIKLAQLKHSIEVKKEYDYKEKENETERINNDSEIIVPVDQSKFAQIYGKAKGRLKEAFSKLRNAFNRDRQVGIDDKENANDNEQR